ncbi:MAG: hypothetical protein K5787_00390 [Lentisphaeria bacterium]|nr:hypothetical protein [Victivallales bacterium]MBR6056828.1 hypothetical protein [Victivallales bacterium]MCR4572202.1 hypothetical protein [Lentisphaeria bacterium]
MKKDKTIFAMNAVAIILVEDIAKEFGKPTEDVLLDFMQSKTADNLYDDSLKLWWDGPSAVGERYKKELISRDCGETR